MTAVSVHRVRRSDPTTPDLDAFITRTGLRVEWMVTNTATGEVVASGRAFTKTGALVDAAIAANSPGVVARLRNGGEPR